MPVRRKTYERCDHACMAFDPNEYNLREKAMKRVRELESDCVKLPMKAKELHKACERASEIRKRTLHRHEQNRMRMASMRESRD